MPGDYTIRNLRDVEDAAVAFGFSETQEARFPRDELGCRATGLSHHVVRPGKRQAFAHRHGVAEEVYLILTGSGRVKLDEEMVGVSAMDAIRVSPRVIRQFEAGPDGLEFLAFGPYVPDDAEMVQGSWGA